MAASAVGREVRLRFCALLLVARGAGAQLDPHTVQPERPTVATHAGTVAPGWLEIESGLERDRLAGVSSITTPTDLKFGVAPRTQLTINPTLVHTTAGTGLGDLLIGVKVRLLDDAPLIGDFAILPSITFPTGSVDRGFGGGERAGSLLFISSHDFGGVALDVNVGYSVRHALPEHATLWTVSLGGPIGGDVGWVFETFGRPGSSGPNGEDGSVGLLFGPTWSVRPWLAVDAGIIAEVFGPQPHALYAGFVYNVGRFLPESLTR